MITKRAPVGDHNPKNEIIYILSIVYKIISCSKIQIIFSHCLLGSLYYWPVLFVWILMYYSGWGRIWVSAVNVWSIASGQLKKTSCFPLRNANLFWFSSKCTNMECHQWKKEKQFWNITSTYERCIKGYKVGPFVCV